ncbi:hypothetical protein Ptr902_07433 [Pyrenophora tritici-repentis]|nr:hypothetical protein Ptr902_07433 [Pyrenophora tritici-repentis]
MVLSVEKRQDSTRGTPQYRRSTDRDDEMVATRLPGTEMLDSFTHAPLDISRGGSAADLESIENFALWEWDEPEIDMDAPYCHLASAAQMWDLSSRHDILSGTILGVNNSTGEPLQQPSPQLSDIHQRAQSQNDQPLFAPATDVPKNPNPSGSPVSDILSDISRNVDCKCSSQIGQLMGWVSLRPTTLLPLDVVFALEQLLNQTKNTISACKNCSLSSPYMSMMFCTSMSWVIEHLETYIRGTTGVSAHSGQITHLTVGGLRLSKEMSQTCFEALVKLRLRRVVQTARELAGFNSEVKSTLLDGVRSAAAETGAAAQQMFGMLEMRAAF